ncbi:MAG: peptide chain release factor N(5)-glutamine methyltransferase [Bacteroidia bacterium]
MTLKEFSILFREKLLELYEPSECNALVKYLLQERLQWSFSELKKNEDQMLSPEVEMQLQTDLGLLSTGAPVQHVLGFAWFNELKLKVSRDVLIPRPETEELVSFIEDYSLPPDAAVLDICTGSGCIALALKSHYPHVRVFGADVSPAALEIARWNSQNLGLEVEFFIWDVITCTEPDMELPGFDVIVSNPPYVMMEEIHQMHRNVSGFEPHLALFVPDDEPLLFYEIIAGYAARKLKRGGRLWFEINRQFGEEVGTLLEKKGFSDIRIYHDISENDRFVSGVWLE